MSDANDSKCETDGCEMTVKRKGRWCVKHYYEWKALHDPTAAIFKKEDRR